MLSLGFNLRAGSLGAPACAVWAHPPLPPHMHVTSGESLPSSGKFPLVQLAANSPSFWGVTASQMGRETRLRIKCEAQPSPGDAQRGCPVGKGALPPALLALYVAFGQRSSSSSLLRKHSRGQGRSQDSPTKRNGLDPHRMYGSGLGLGFRQHCPSTLLEEPAHFLRVFKPQNRVQVSCTILLEARIAANCLSGVWPKCW